MAKLELKPTHKPVQNDSLAFDADLIQPTALIDALASQSFSRAEFLQKPKRFLKLTCQPDVRCIELCRT